MVLKLNLFFGGEPTKTFIKDISTLNKIPENTLKTLLDKIVKLRFLRSITNDDFKEWEKTTKVSKADLRSSAGLLAWCIKRTLQIKINNNNLLDDFKKLKLNEYSINIIIDYLEKNRDKIKTAFFEGKEYMISTLDAMSYRIDYKIEDVSDKILSPTIILEISIDDRKTDEIIHEIFEMKIDTFRAFIDQLNEALIKMENLVKNKDKINKFMENILNK